MGYYTDESALVEKKFIYFFVEFNPHMVLVGLPRGILAIGFLGIVLKCHASQVDDPPLILQRTPTTRGIL